MKTDDLAKTEGIVFSVWDSSISNASEPLDTPELEEKIVDGVKNVQHKIKDFERRRACSLRVAKEKVRWK